LPKPELDKFAKEVIERFQNPFIKHELASIALNSISKYKVRVLPSVTGYMERKNALPERLLHSLAALIRFYKGEYNGEALPVNDTPDIIAFFKKTWASKDNAFVVKETLGNKEFWGMDLNELPGVTAFVTKSLETF